MFRRFPLSVPAILLLAGCTIDAGQQSQNATETVYAEGSREALAILAVANDTSLGVMQYDAPYEQQSQDRLGRDRPGVGLDARAAQNLIAHRDGDALESTEDDNLFDALAELGTVSYCKARCFDSLLDYAQKTGVYDSSDGDEVIDVVFSPQPTKELSHLQEVADRIDQAERSIDIAMYSYSHADPIRAAIARAIDRGVTVRWLADTALANADYKMAPLEDMGIDVRRVTKVMHHKMAIIDGPRDDAHLAAAETATLITGSGNWSNSAGTKYDENTLFISGHAELNLRMQREFDTLWAGSRDKVYNAALQHDLTHGSITDDLIAQYEDPDAHVFFTSANFNVTASKSWTYLGTTAVTDVLVAAIQSAETSIDIASGHFVSVPIAQAVADAMQNNPSLDVEIVLDCQETSKSDGEIGQLKSAIENMGGTIRYKCNTYRWHYVYAQQMHHKYLIVDEDELYTGSLNFSDSAETGTFENMFWLRGPQHAQLIDSFLDNHADVLAYGHESDMAAYADLMSDVEGGPSTPLTWDTPIALPVASFNDLKTAIRAACPATQPWLDPAPEGSATYDAHFQNHPEWFTYCSKTGYPWPSVPASARID
jgi:phosphatidylserine/phosphatidylglycerophosphate/cardiolipin synthase-like enzyme